MLLRLNEHPIIRNLRDHSPETVDKLRALLASGTMARTDPRRKNFYEVEAGSRVFYIHVSPATNKVMLLAIWDNDTQEQPARNKKLPLTACCAPAR
jgi:hypothetical protein